MDVVLIHLGIKGFSAPAVQVRDDVALGDQQAHENRGTTEDERLPLRQERLASMHKRGEVLNPNQQDLGFRLPRGQILLTSNCRWRPFENAGSERVTSRGHKARPRRLATFDLAYSELDKDIVWCWSRADVS